MPEQSHACEPVASSCQNECCRLPNAMFQAGVAANLRLSQHRPHLLPLVDLGALQPNGPVPPYTELVGRLLKPQAHCHAFGDSCGIFCRFRLSPQRPRKQVRIETKSVISTAQKFQSQALVLALAGRGICCMRRPQHPLRPRALALLPKPGDRSPVIRLWGIPLLLV